MTSSAHGKPSLNMQKSGQIVLHLETFNFKYLKF